MLVMLYEKQVCSFKIHRVMKSQNKDRTGLISRTEFAKVKKVRYTTQYYITENNADAEDISISKGNNMILVK